MPWTEEGDGSERKHWVTALPLEQVLAAAKKKKKFHQSRVEHWLKERTKAEKIFKKKGLKIVPNIANTTANYLATVSNSKREVAQIDNKILQDWQNANAKAEQHKDLVRQFDRWVQFLGVGEFVLDFFNLSMADAEFFGLVEE